MVSNNLLWLAIVLIDKKTFFSVLIHFFEAWSAILAAAANFCGSGSHKDVRLVMRLVAPDISVFADEVSFTFKRAGVRNLGTNKVLKTFKITFTLFWGFMKLKSFLKSVFEIIS
jgi:hypothetical protein